MSAEDWSWNWPLLRRELATRPRRDLSTQMPDQACVGLILSGLSSEPEIALIRRRVSPRDPWSGQIALPGGRRETGDADDRAVVLREIHEETGWRLGDEHIVTPISDWQAHRQGAPVAMSVRPFVLMADGLPAPRPQEVEVDRVLSLPLSHLWEESRHVHIDVPRPQGTIALPALQLDTGDTLWGLTYLILSDFLEGAEAIGALRGRRPLRDVWRFYPTALR